MQRNALAPPSRSSSSAKATGLGAVDSFAGRGIVRKTFWVLQGLPVYLCGRCGYLEVGEDNDGLQTES
jgi:hypothetical protein